MGFSLAVTVLLVFSCISQIRGATVLEVEERSVGPVGNFRLHILEKGTRFNERIQIDKKKDIEYFNVPPHNGLSQTDNMYDFRMNITVSRVKKDRVCHISPLPADLPRPNMMSKELKSLSNSPPITNIKKNSQLWRLGARVDKSTLRKEVRDFCGEFPIYRLERYYGLNRGSDRTKRALPNIPLCTGNFPGNCHPNQWKYSCRIQSGGCVYYVICHPDTQRKQLGCSTLVEHRYNSIVCCIPSCPSG